MSKRSKECSCKKLYPDWIRVSPSQIKTHRDCNRKWAYNKVDGIEGEQSVGAAFGEEMHGHGEEWMRFRQAPPKTPAGQAFAQGIGKKDFVPNPRPGQLIEYHFVIELPELDRVLLHGYIDLLVPDVRPPIVIDYKFTKSRKWIPTLEELKLDPQPLIYAAAGFLLTGAPVVETRWCYFITDAKRVKPKGTTKRSLMWNPDDLDDAGQWSKIIEDSATIAHTRRTAKKAVDVSANRAACRKFGGCEFYDICPREGSSALAHIRQDDRFRATKDKLTQLNTGER